MFKRTSIVNDIDTTALTISSIAEIGDSAHIHAFSRAFALQREEQLFLGDEAPLGNYDIFNRPFPDEPLAEHIQFESIAVNPFIKVGSINITAISSSSILHIGSSRNICLESRIKHVRHLREKT